MNRKLFALGRLTVPADLTDGSGVLTENRERAEHRDGLPGGVTMDHSANLDPGQHDSTSNTQLTLGKQTDGSWNENASRAAELQEGYAIMR